MNLCVVSTFSCTTDGFMAMVADFEEELQPCVSDWEIAVINDHKICTMLNVTDMEAFETIMTGTKMTSVVVPHPAPMAPANARLPPRGNPSSR